MVSTMSMYSVAPNYASHRYRILLRSVEEEGVVTPSRHGPTLELLGQQVVFFGSNFPLRLGMNESLGWMEALQIVAGIFEPDLLKQVAPRAAHDLFTAQMAYGPRLRSQVDEALVYLRRDPDGRQAVVFIADPSDGMTDGQTCTTSVQFLLRQGFLTEVVSMRSWDLVKGLPYDVMFFQLLKALMCRDLGAAPGRLVVNVGSAHIYDADRLKAATAGQATFQLNLAVPSTWSEMREWARREVATYRKREWPTGVRVSRVFDAVLPQGVDRAEV